MDKVVRGVSRRLNTGVKNGQAPTYIHNPHTPSEKLNPHTFLKSILCMKRECLVFKHTRFIHRDASKVVEA